MDHPYHMLRMSSRVLTNLKHYTLGSPYPQLVYTEGIKNLPLISYTSYITTSGSRSIKGFKNYLQDNIVAKCYFTLYLCKYNPYGNIYGYKDDTEEGIEEKTSRHVLNLNFWDNYTIGGNEVHEKIFSITKDFTAVELDGIEYEGYDPNVIPLERYTKMYDLLFYPCASTMVYKIY